MASSTSPDGIVYPDASDPIAPLNAVFQDLAESVQDALDNIDPGAEALDDLTDVDITTPAAGDKLVYDGNDWVNVDGYLFVETVYFTSSGTFAKATYPWLRAIRVKCQAGGGGGGGVGSVGGGSAGTGRSGGGGGYAESFITDIAGLDASVTVTRGSGGAGGAAGFNNGNTGGSSSFGSGTAYEVSSTGGGPGLTIGGLLSRDGAPGGSGDAGDILIFGDAAGNYHGLQSDPVVSNTAGGSVLGAVRGGALATGSGGSTAGATGRLYGGGGSGAAACQNNVTSRTGGDGADGIVIVELYA
jgi:hypothetical protein